MPKCTFSLLRQRRRYMERNETWFSINRFKHQHGELLTSPTPKFLEIQEMEYEQDSMDPESLS